MSFPSPADRAHLDAPLHPTEAQRAAFAAQGHLTVRAALDPAVVTAAAPVLTAAFAEHRGVVLPVADRPTAYDRAFVQQVNLGDREPAVAALTRCCRLASFAADLLDADGLHLFVEDAFFKEPGSERTPWHQDASAIPIEADAIVTAWIPLLPVAPGQGALQFAQGSHRDGLAGPVDISEQTEAAFQRLVHDAGYPVHTVPALTPGDVSFHAGATIHAAGANPTDHDRPVFALHLFAAGARIVADPNPSQRNLLQRLAPHLAPGELAVSPRWPELPVAPAA